MQQLGQEFYRLQGKKLLIQLIISAILISLAGISLGFREIFLGIIEGYMMTAIYFFIMAFRINRLIPGAQRRSKMEMWVGLIFRLLALLIIAKLAFMKSTVVGYTSLLVFLWGYLLVMINLIYFNLKDVQ